MPKPRMDQAIFFEKKELIIDIAAQIITEEGYQSLSMRKIGARIGMTAANLYNYYSNKDELNIAIRTRAGKLLFSDLKQAWEKGGSIEEKIRHMIAAYLAFGLDKANYYTILFDMQTPKYADYVGSVLEILALGEKESTEQSLGLLRQCIEDLKQGGFQVPEDTSAFLLMLWGQLHGLVSLYNNNLVSEINPKPEQSLKKAADLVYDALFHFLKPGRNKG